MTPPNTEPSEDVPDEIATLLEESSNTQLRAIIRYAQGLLHDHPPLMEAIEARQGEELVRMEDEGAHTVVVMRPTSGDEQDHPKAYMVRWEPGFQNKEGEYKWNYLGEANDD